MNRCIAFNLLLKDLKVLLAAGHIDTSESVGIADALLALAPICPAEERAREAACEYTIEEVLAGAGAQMPESEL